MLGAKTLPGRPIFPSQGGSRHFPFLPDVRSSGFQMATHPKR